MNNQKQIKMCVWRNMAHSAHKISVQHPKAEWIFKDEKETKQSRLEKKAVSKKDLTLEEETVEESFRRYLGHT